MDFNQFKTQIFELAEKKGFDDYELYYQSSSSLGLDVFEGKIDEFTNTVNGGVSFRGILNGKSAIAYSEIIDESTAAYLVDRTYEIVKYIEDEDEVILHDGSGDYNDDLDMYFPEIDLIPIEDKINFVLDLEKKASKIAEIDKVIAAHYSDAKMSIKIANSKGMNLEETQNYIYTYVGLSKSDSKDNYCEYQDKIAYNYQDILENNILEKATNELLKKMNSTSLETGDYPCIFRYDAASSLLSAFSGSFNARACQKGYSPYADKIGQKIASDIIDIIDNPHIPKGLASSKFDAEGVATFKKTIVEKGVLKTHLHNLATAKKAGVKSTGNASRGGFKSDIGISPSNFYIENGDVSFDELLSQMGEGIVITEMEGLHSGLDAISGNFSLSAKGFYHKDGVLKPVYQIVITDNFYDMIKRVQKLGNDLDLSITSIGSPSILIDKISVAGKSQEDMSAEDED